MDKCSTISSSVTSFRSSIRSTTNASCASSADGRLQPCGRDIGSPCIALAIQRISVEIPAPNLAAACRADMPAADALNTRSRRSCSMPAPSSTSLLGMLNQLRLSLSPHNRFIDHRTCLSYDYCASREIKKRRRGRPSSSGDGGRVVNCEAAILTNLGRARV